MMQPNKHILSVLFFMCIPFLILTACSPGGGGSESIAPIDPLERKSENFLVRRI